MVARCSFCGSARGLRQRLAAGEQVARMYQEPGLTWLERQADVAETLVAERRAEHSKSDANQLVG
jgi:hypothetical protein